MQRVCLIPTLAALLLPASLAMAASADRSGVAAADIRAAGVPAVPANAALSETERADQLVEVRLTDGSLLRGEWKSLGSLKLSTPYGSLQFPSSALLNVTRGQRLGAEDAKIVGTLIAKLDADDYASRTEAQAKLESFGYLVLPALQAARTGATAEAKNRLEAILKKIEASTKQRPRPDDMLSTAEFDIAGRLDIETVALHSRHGELRVLFDEIDTIRWPLHAQSATLALPAAKATQGWVDTGIDSLPGKPFVVVCSGRVNYSGSEVMPTGCEGWGKQPNGYYIGVVMGRFGTSGEPFVVGNGVKLAPRTNERLYLRIFVTEQFMRNGGAWTKEFTVNVASGACTDQLDVPAAPGEGGELAMPEGSPAPPEAVRRRRIIRD